jgi:hypothetical protein
MTGSQDDEPPTFEDVVAALLQVDPTGITGQRAKRRDDDGEKVGEAEPES